jgi:hypothetical protein
VVRERFTAKIAKSAKKIEEPAQNQVDNVAPTSPRHRGCGGSTVAESLTERFLCAMLIHRLEHTAVPAFERDDANRANGIRIIRRDLSLV